MLQHRPNLNVHIISTTYESKEDICELYLSIISTHGMEITGSSSCL